MSIIQGWHTKQLDFVLTFTQTPVRIDNLYMQKFLKGCRVPGAVSDNDYVLKVQKNIYGQKQAGWVWNKHYLSKLTSKAIGFTHSEVDECALYKGYIVWMYSTPTIPSW